MKDQELKQYLSLMMKPIEAQVMMCDDKNELLLLASCMLAAATQIYRTNLSDEGAIFVLNNTISRMKNGKAER